MLKIIISGCSGHMGHTVARLAAEDKDVSIACGFDVNAIAQEGFPVYASPVEYGGSADAVIDFSNSAALTPLLEYCKAKKLPPVLCTTGYSPEQLAEIEKAAEIIPVFRSGNMSLGINLMAELIRRACSVLGDKYDVEIVEKHHRRKLDAPSGTAVMLADAAAQALPYDAKYVYERESRRQPRDGSEIGISSIRGGTIVGEHEIIFAGTDEVIEIKHTAYSRDIFANGALRAAKFMAGVTKPGMYDMGDVLSAE